MNRMKTSIGLSILIIAGLALVAAECALLARRTDTARWFEDADATRTAWADKLEFTDTSATFARGAMHHVALADDEPARIVLAFDKPKGYPIEGTWTSPQVRTDYAFTELLPSWNL